MSLKHYCRDYTTDKDVVKKDMVHFLCSWETIIGFMVRHFYYVITVKLYISSKLINLHHINVKIQQPFPFFYDVMDI